MLYQDCWKVSTLRFIALADFCNSSFLDPDADVHSFVAVRGSRPGKTVNLTESEIKTM